MEVWISTVGFLKHAKCWLQMMCIQVEEVTLGSKGLRKLPALVKTDGWAKWRGFWQFFIDLLAFFFKEYYSTQIKNNTTKFYTELQVVHIFLFPRLCLVKLKQNRNEGHLVWSINPSIFFNLFVAWCFCQKWRPFLQQNHLDPSRGSQGVIGHRSWLLFMQRCSQTNF